MKTFETEKGNIPEGATHYQDQDGEHLFAWFKLNGEDLSINVPDQGVSDAWFDCSISYFRGKIKPIPQTKEVEWVNGDACRYANDIKHDYTYIGEHPHGDGHYAFSEEKGITYIANGYLLEPEAESERKEREELEAAYDLCCTFNDNYFVSADEFKNYHSSLCEKWLKIVRKTNYKVKGE